MFVFWGGGFSCSALHCVFIYLTITSQTLAKHFKLDAPETAGVSYLRHRATRADLICYTFCLRAQYVMTLCAESRLENVFQKWWITFCSPGDICTPGDGVTFLNISICQHVSVLIFDFKKNERTNVWRRKEENVGDLYQTFTKKQLFTLI